MTLIYPEATPVQGNISLLLMTDVADADSVSLASEVGDAASLNVSCFVRDFNPELTSNSGSAPPRLCTTVQLPVEGLTQFSAIEVRYVHDPQAADSTDDNKAKAFLTRGTEFYALERQGLDAQTVAFAVGQRYKLWRFRAGRQNEGRSGTDEFAEFEIVQQWFPLGEPVPGVLVA